MIFLLPPSEGKQSGGDSSCEKLSFNFPKPLDIALHATSKDLKCTGIRYKEGILLNKSIAQGPWMPAIHRYAGVMFKALEYTSLEDEEKKYFNDTVCILSGMYGVTAPTDHIANYKLPIGTKGLLSFWGDMITRGLNTLSKTQIVDLLPGSYKKMIQRGNLKHEVVHVDFFQEGKKLTHTVKGVKGRWLREQIQLGMKKLELGESVYEDQKGTILVVTSS